MVVANFEDHCFRVAEPRGAGGGRREEVAVGGNARVWINCDRSNTGPSWCWSREGTQYRARFGLEVPLSSNGQRTIWVGTAHPEFPLPG